MIFKMIRRLREIFIDPDTTPFEGEPDEATNRIPLAELPIGFSTSIVSHSLEIRSDQHNMSLADAEARRLRARAEGPSPLRTIA